jgi:hypothetical protein
MMDGDLNHPMNGRDLRERGTPSSTAIGRVPQKSSTLEHSP